MRFIVKERSENFLPAPAESLYHEAMKVRWYLSTVLFFVLAALVVVSSVQAQTVSVSASPSVITDAGEDSTLTLTVSPPSSKNLSINFFLTGTAAYGSDYILVGNFNRSGQFIIPAGQNMATITLHSFYDDDRPGTEETVFFTLTHGRKYQVGSPSRAQVTIENVE